MRLELKHSYLMDDNSEVKKSKGTKSVIKRELMFENYRDCLSNHKIILKSQQRFKNDHHKVYTEEVNKIALSSDDDKRLQTVDRVTTYPHGTNAFKVCESKMMIMRDFLLKITQIVRFMMKSYYSHNKDLSNDMIKT